MARTKGKGKDTQEQVKRYSRQEVAARVLELGTEEQLSRLEYRLGIGEVMAHREEGTKAETVASDVRALAKERGIKAPSGLSKTALSKAESVYSHYVASGAADVATLRDLGASFEKLYVNVNEDARQVIASYHDMPSTTKRAPTGNTQFTVPKELEDALRDVARHMGTTGDRWQVPTIRGLIETYKSATDYVPTETDGDTASATN